MKIKRSGRACLINGEDVQYAASGISNGPWDKFMSKETIHYKTKGTCSRAIQIEIEDGRIARCAFEKGCSGNTQGLCRLLEGVKVEDVIDKLSGIQCQNGTSCPDQLARALVQWRNGKA